MSVVCSGQYDMSYVLTDKGTSSDYDAATTLHSSLSVTKNPSLCKNCQKGVDSARECFSTTCTHMGGVASSQTNYVSATLWGGIAGGQAADSSSLCVNKNVPKEAA